MLKDLNMLCFQKLLEIVGDLFEEYSLDDRLVVIVFVCYLRLERDDRATILFEVRDASLSHIVDGNVALV